MTDDHGWLHGQQLLELLAVISSYPDEESAVRGAVERAAQALEAEVAAVVIGGQVVASVGFPAARLPEDDLVAVARRERDTLTVPGVGDCPAVTARWGGTHPGTLLLARWADGFTIQEKSLVRGMARLLELTLTMLRALQRSERQAAENAELLRSLRQRQRLVEHLFDIQRAISRRRPLAQILDMITGAAQDLLGDEIVGLWLRESPEGDDTRLVAHVGLRTEVARRRPTVPLAEAGAAGQAMLTDDVVVLHGYAETSTLIAELSDGRLCASMAAPVHDSGAVSGSLMVGSHRQTRGYTASDVQTLRAFAEHVSLALTDANTVDRMYQAFHDSLTGLASRGLFLEELAKRLGAAEHDGKRVALLFLDLDRFKAVNDSLGHAAGDDLLTITAGRLKSQLRAVDVAARFGGDEFAVLLYGVATTSDAARVAERILRTIGEPMPVAGRHLRVNASIGIALSTPGMPDPADLMRRADVAMYQAKRNGRGRLEVFTDEMLLSFPTAD
nr:sensor domain-containing diguanylate cyclase [Kibdelosporangium sp. MJ126-NF4]CEL22672.1 diguanylate cyclase/phosphodiesterase (GGDEF & EAL domains) with PAS/PAC sensor(s) [Kibdelosporangium sp. MJ126-NF4]CTQ89813.1 diguanylate cyclase/phosphodiesterase (GGDEF & EAL domains) with PAS/PAC sensor(s) [Kibdelosporangium sp. MJ126-NF4]